MITLYALGSVLAVSLIAFIGLVTLSWSERFVRKCTFLMISLATGALLGDALIHLLPEAFEEMGNHALTAFLALLGFLSFFVLEHLLHWHHHANEKPAHAHEDLATHDGKQHVKPLGYLILVSDGVHNFIDGVIIAASFLVSVEIGIATTIAVILHEIPQEISDFGVLLHAGFSKTKALLLNFASALAAIAGALVALLVGIENDLFVPSMAAFAAGSFIYIAGSDIIPELHRSESPARSFLQFIAILVGVGLMFALVFVE